MTCANCQRQLVSVSLGQIEVLHCPNCGGSFFEENEINRLSLSQAKKLAAGKKTNFISGKTKLCPKDNFPLRAIQEESIPQFVTLLRCEKCRGIFAFAEDLVNFKKAQETKLNFFRTWHIPLPSLKSVLVYSFLILTAASALFSFGTINIRQSLQTQADEVVKSIKISQVDKTTVVYFVTKTAFQSEVIFLNQATGQEMRKIISEKPSKTHFLTISDILSSESISLQIILTSGSNRIETKPIPFVAN